MVISLNSIVDMVGDKKGVSKQGSSQFCGAGFVLLKDLCGVVEGGAVVYVEGQYARVQMGICNWGAIGQPMFHILVVLAVFATSVVIGGLLESHPEFKKVVNAMIY